ncbi:MAG TPA: TetR/AcrR family transcriptional regulator [Kofleriaceae bacterium]|nr:TetR/AcrR family transcriptional regulator [Kofleriaceae bacterium]
MAVTDHSELESRTSKRARILDAALDLFVEHGFHGTAVPALADRAGVGAGTIYRYFENKEALVNELYRACKAEVASHVTACMSLEVEPRELFARFWRTTVGYASAHPRAFAFLELHHHASYLDADSRAMEERVYTLSESFLGWMRERMAIKDLPPPIMMAVVYGALIGFVRGAWEGRYPLDETHIAAAELCAWEAIRR